MAAGQLSLTRRALLAGACAAPLAGGGGGVVKMGTLYIFGRAPSRFHRLAAAKNVYCPVFFPGTPMVRTPLLISFCEIYALSMH